MVGCFTLLLMSVLQPTTTLTLSATTLEYIAQIELDAEAYRIVMNAVDQKAQLQSLQSSASASRDGGSDGRSIIGADVIDSISGGSGTKRSKSTSSMEQSNSMSAVSSINPDSNPGVSSKTTGSVRADHNTHISDMIADIEQDRFDSDASTKYINDDNHDNGVIQSAVELSTQQKRQNELFRCVTLFPFFMSVVICYLTRLVFILWV